MKNKYFYRSRISEARFREIIRHFAMDINVSKTALLCGGNILSNQKSDILEYSLTNIPEIEGKVLEGSTIYSDDWKAYDIEFRQDEFVRGKSHINGIESFWSFAKKVFGKI